MTKPPQLQLGLFGPIQATGSAQKPKNSQAPEPVHRAEVRLGTKKAQIPLQQQRRAAWAKLKDILRELEGKDVFIGTYGASHNHFWLHNLKLVRLKVENMIGEDRMPAVIVLWGTRGASVRIFTEQMVNVREQQYQGYTLWLVDFWNGFGEYPLDPYKPKGWVSLDIVRFKD